MLLIASSSSLIVFSAGAAIVSFFLIRHAHRYLARGRQEQGSALPDHDASSEAGHGTRAGVLSAEVARGQVQLHEMARDLMGELDTKMRALQVLIRLADESTARLKMAIRRSEQPATGHPGNSLVAQNPPQSAKEFAESNGEGSRVDPGLQPPSD